MEIEILEMTFKKRINADYIQVAGDYFAKINGNKCKLIISNKKYPLKRVVPINDFNTNKIKMIFYENIYNKSCMFKNCEELESISRKMFKDGARDSQNNDEVYDIIFHDENKRKLIDYFNNNENDSSMISTIQEGSKINTDIEIYNFYYKEINDLLNLLNKPAILKEMFSNCISLVSLPDISNWDFTDVIDISKMFSNCVSLTTFPNISNWNTNNCFDMSYIFSNCKNLKTLPDISKWNTNNNLDCKYMFSNC